MGPQDTFGGQVIRCADRGLLLGAFFHRIEPGRRSSRVGSLTVESDAVAVIADMTGHIMGEWAGRIEAAWLTTRD